MGTPATSIPLAAGAIAGVPAGSTYMGLVARDTASAVGGVRVYDGTDATGVLVDAVNYLADGTQTTWYGPGGKRVKTGLFVVLVGTPAGSVVIA